MAIVNGRGHSKVLFLNASNSKSCHRRCPRYCIGLISFAFGLVFLYIVICYFDVPVIPDSDVEGWPANKSRDVLLYLSPEEETATIAQPDLCRPTLQDGEDLILLVVVFSPPENEPARTIIRNCWASWQTTLKGVRVAFLLGKSLDPALQTKVLAESEKYADIIQESFVDSYNNLTLKSLHLLKWLNTHCSSSSTSPAFVMKTDEDTFVNLPRLLTLLEYILRNPDNYPTSGFVFGNLFCDGEPIRSRSSKFYAPRYMFQGNLYPAYVAGAGYIMSKAALSPLYQAALKLKFFHMEDIFVTGMSRRAAGIPALHHKEFNFLRENPFIACRYMKLIIGHQISAEDQGKVWKELHMDNFRCNALKGQTLMRDLERNKSPLCF